MGSLIDELQRREAAARAEAEELRGRIAKLTERPARAEERLSRLVIARETVDEVLSEAGADAPPAVERELTTRPRRSPVIGVVIVPPWRACPRCPCCRRSTGTCWRWPRMQGGRCGLRRSPRRPGLSMDRGRWRPCVEAEATDGMVARRPRTPFSPGWTSAQRTAAHLCPTRRSAPSSPPSRSGSRAPRPPANVDKPVLVVNGADDTMLPTISSFHLARMLPDVQLSIYPNSGHGGIFQHHDLFVAQGLGFLRDLHGTPPPSPAPKDITSSTESIRTR